MSADARFRGGGTRKEWDGGRTRNWQPEAAAAYVAELSRDLALIARRHDLHTLGFILEMARLEAENTALHMNGRD
jgi:hypothetical protein